jgi:hypothetical protein
MGTKGSSYGVKRSECEADNSPPSSAEVKKAWSYTSIPQHVFMAWCLVKHRDNFTFTFHYIIILLSIPMHTKLSLSFMFPNQNFIRIFQLF